MMTRMVADLFSVDLHSHLGVLSAPMTTGLFSVGFHSQMTKRNNQAPTTKIPNAAQFYLG
jgi:hypothetical protein